MWFRSDKPRVAVIRLHGVIGKEVGFKKGMTLELLDPILTKAFKLPDVKAVILLINSPGGSPVQSDLICQRIRQLSKEQEVPVYSFVEDVAASGGYWLACAGDEIYAMGASIIGSIGVISSGFGFANAIKKLGIERRIYKQGKNKALLDPFSKVDPEEVAIVTRAQSVIHDLFKELVLERRGHKINKKKSEQLFTGEFWAGNDAKVLGLIDGIASMYEIMENKYGPDIAWVKLAPSTGWFKQRFGLSIHRMAHEICDVAEERSLWGQFRA